MLQKTNGIVLSYIKYKDSSIIVRVFTEEFGMRSYLVNGVRKKNKGNKLIFYQPLSILELVVYENEKRDINRISEVKFLHQPQTIPFDVVKSSIALFLCEFLEKIIFDSESNQFLFEYLKEQLILFDNQKEHFENFHILLLIQLTNLLGIEINAENSNSDQLKNLLLNKLENLNGNLRKELLEEIIEHYHYHLGSSRNIKSLEVLSTVLN